MKKTTLHLAHLLTRHACLWAALGPFAALTFVGLPARAAVTEAWVHRYSNVVSNAYGNAYDQAGKVVRDTAGDIIVTGLTDDGITGGNMLTIKYSGADGYVLWQQLYNGPANLLDYATAVAVDGSNNVVVTGYSVGSGNAVVTGYSSAGGSSYDYYTAKYAAADGALLWEKRYNGGAANSLALGPNGMVAVTGSSSGDYATVVYRENLPPVSIALVPAGIRLRFIGAPGRSYTIQRASAVTGPWTTLATPTAPTSGLIEYVDTNLTVGTTFYRTVQP